MVLITRLLAGLSSRTRIAYYRARGMQIRGHVLLRAIEVRGNYHSVTLEQGVALDRGVLLLSTSPQARIHIGERCYINRHTMIDCSERVELGADTMIGPFCYVTDHDHSFGPATIPSAGVLVTKRTTIGARCWLGAHVTVLKGVSIGEGSVIGAGSVVTRSIPTGVVAAGNPARVLRQISA